MDIEKDDIKICCVLKELWIRLQFHSVDIKTKPGWGKEEKLDNYDWSVRSRRGQ